MKHDGSLRFAVSGLKVQRCTEVVCRFDMDMTGCLRVAREITHTEILARWNRGRVADEPKIHDSVSSVGIGALFYRHAHGEWAHEDDWLVGFVGKVLFPSLLELRTEHFEFFLAGSQFDTCIHATKTSGKPQHLRRQATEWFSLVSEHALAILEPLCMPH